LEIDRLSEKSILRASYQSGANPGIYPLLAILTAISDSITYDDIKLDGDRMQEVFRYVIGQDYEHVVARQLRVHVRQLCAKIVLEARKAMIRINSLTKKHLLERLQAIRAKVSANTEKSVEITELDDAIEEENLLKDLARPEENKAPFRTEEERNSEYLWLLRQLRVFLLAYSKLESFMQLQRRWGIILSVLHKEKHAPWPIVCLIAL
jgi:hypothetical protein